MSEFTLKVRLTFDLEKTEKEFYKNYIFFNFGSSNHEYFYVWSKKGFIILNIKSIQQQDNNEKEKHQHGKKKSDRYYERKRGKLIPGDGLVRNKLY